MELWQNWLVGFVIWFFALIFYVAFSIYVVHGKGGKAPIPDEAFNYKYRPDFIPKDAYLVDLHSHTLGSDGWMTPEQNIRWHIANGFDAFAVTDHNTGKNNQVSLDLQEKYPEILIIPGYEWTTGRVHINIIDVLDFQKPTSMANPSDEEIKEIIKKAHEMNAIIQLDHWTWTQDRGPHRKGELTEPSRKDLIEWGIDGFEINNEMRWYDPKTVHLLEQWKNDGTLDRPIYQSTGTDIHNPSNEWATCWTELLLTDDEKKNPTADIVKKALKEGRTKIWVDHDYRDSPEIKFMDKNKNLKETVFAPQYQLIKGVEKFPGTIAGGVSTLIWYLLSYFPLRIFIELISRI